MADVKCMYFCEGPCEEKLINALKQSPNKIIQGKVKIFNIVQNLIPKSQLISIQPGSYVVFVFDTDVLQTDILKQNIERLNKFCHVTIVNLAQVRNLEDELTRCTDVKSAPELTKSKGINNFKAAFCKMKDSECRLMLERHKIDTSKLWTTSVSSDYSFIEQNSEKIKR